MVLKFSREVAMATKFWISDVNYTKSSITPVLCIVASKFLLLVWDYRGQEIPLLLKFSREVAMATSENIRRSWHMVWELNSIGQIHVPQNVFLVLVKKPCMIESIKVRISKICLEKP